MAKSINEIEQKLKRVEALLSDEKMPTVTMSEIAWESCQERWHKKDKRQMIYCVILSIMLLVSNLAWLWLWSQS